MIGEKLSNKYKLTLLEGTIVEGSTFIQMAKRLGEKALDEAVFINPIFKNPENNKEVDFISLLSSTEAVSEFESISVSLETE